MICGDDIVDCARGELGYREEGVNETKYNRAYYNNDTAAPWCVTFVWWVFDRCGASGLFYGGGKTASCTEYWRWAKSTGHVTTTPKYGDIVIYNWDGLGAKSKVAHHMGIYVKSTSSTVTTIEGNTSTDSDTVDRVMVRDRGRKMVCAYISVDYDARFGKLLLWQQAHIADGGALPKYGADGEYGPETEKGMSRHLLTYRGKDYRYQNQVKLLQSLLGLPAEQIDGKFGPTTLWHVQRYQRTNGLECDGIVGPATWRRLLGVVL